MTTFYTTLARCNTFLPKYHGTDDSHRCPRGFQQQDMGKICSKCGMEFVSHYGKNRHEKFCGRDEDFFSWVDSRLLPVTDEILNFGNFQIVVQLILVLVSL